jgi:transcriptional regulator with XRE-family HTH domain
MTYSSQNQIWLYESGKRMPSLDKLILLAEVLQTSTDWLLGLSDDIMPIRSSKDLSDAELRLLNMYRSKSPESQQKILEIAKVV